MRPLAGVLSCLCLCGVSFGQASAVIRGPDHVNPGNVIFMYVDDASVGDSFEWKLVNSDEPGGQLFDREGRAVFIFWTITPGRYSFALSASKSEGDGKSSVSLAVHTVVVGDTKPVPPRPPEPVPPRPLGLTGVALKAYQAIESSGATMEERQNVAAVMELIQEESAVNGWSITQTRAELGQTLGTGWLRQEETRQRWGAFNAWFGEESRLWSTVDQSRSALRDIAKGLKYVPENSRVLLSPRKPGQSRSLRKAVDTLWMDVERFNSELGT